MTNDNPVNSTLINSLITELLDKSRIYSYFGGLSDSDYGGTTGWSGHCPITNYLKAASSDDVEDVRTFRDTIEVFVRTKPTPFWIQLRTPDYVRSFIYEFDTLESPPRSGQRKTVGEFRHLVEKWFGGEALEEVGFSSPAKTPGEKPTLPLLDRGGINLVVSKHRELFS